jgi:hypothetical protein
MNCIQRFLLKQRVLPTILLFFLLPRSFYYFELYPLVAFIFIFLSLLYMIVRYKIAIKYSNNKKLVIDSLITLVGSILACVYSSFVFLTWIFIVPLLINNYKILIYNKA